MKAKLERYLETVSDILQAYKTCTMDLLENDPLVTDDVTAAVRKSFEGLETELGAADKNITEELDGFIEENHLEESPANRVISILKDHVWYEDEQRDILEALNPDSDDALEYLDSNDGRRYTVNNLNLIQREQLDEFVKTQIFPNCNDQKVNII